MITATPSVVLKNVSGLHVSSRLAADVTKLKLWVPSRKRCRCVFFFDKPTAFAPFKRGVEFCSCFVRSSSTTVLTVKVFTLGGWRWGGGVGIYVHSATCSEKQYWHSALSQSGWWRRRKWEVRWSEERMMMMMMMVVVCDEAGKLKKRGRVCVCVTHGNDPTAPPPKKNNLTCHFSADTRCLDGVNRKGVCVLWNVFVCVCVAFFEIKLAEEEKKQKKNTNWLSDGGAGGGGGWVGGDEGLPMT